MQVKIWIMHLWINKYEYRIEGWKCRKMSGDNDFKTDITKLKCCI